MDNTGRNNNELSELGWTWFITNVYFYRLSDFILIEKISP